MREAIRTTALTVGNPGPSGEEDRGSAEWQAVHLPYIEAINALRTVMRADVQQR